MPFNSTNKYAYILVETDKQDADGANSYYTLYTKGAPERIWALSDTVYYNGKVVPKDP
jgi:sodium/potassium-transporting ATPase subunit alpha